MLAAPFPLIIESGCAKNLMWILLVKLGCAFESVIPRGFCLSNLAVNLILWNGSKNHLVSTCGRRGYCRFDFGVAGGSHPSNYRFRIKVAGRSRPSNHRFRIRVPGRSRPSNYRFRIRVSGHSRPINYKFRMRVAGRSDPSKYRFRIRVAGHLAVPVPLIIDAG